MPWLFRIALFVLLFGVSPIAFGSNQLHPWLSHVVNLTALAGIPALVLCYFRLPGFYKAIAWAVGLGVVLLVLESKYEYGQWVYSYFVIKRFAFCGLALSAYFVMTRVGEGVRLRHAVYLILGFYFVNQLLLGKIFEYSLSSDTRTTSAFEALYLVLPFLYFLVHYLREHKLGQLFGALFSFALIVFLLHRSVITAAVGGAGLVFGLVVIGKYAPRSLPFGRSVAVLAVLLTVFVPLVGLVPEKYAESFMDSMSGLLDPKEDNTGSWRVEQSEFYLKLIPERPLLGWRYAGYDRGEVMENEDFPEKGTIIHSQYIDQLYNYGAVGLGLTVLIIVGTLVAMYRRNRTFTPDQVALFGFIASGLVFGVSYQLPVYYWGFVGVGMYYGLHRRAEDEPQNRIAEERKQVAANPPDSPKRRAVPENQVTV